MNEAYIVFLVERLSVKASQFPRNLVEKLKQN